MKYATDPVGGLGIVVARNPNPVAPALQLCQIVTIRIAQSRWSTNIVKTVAERDNAPWRIIRYQVRQARKRTRGIVGGKHLAACGET